MAEFQNVAIAKEVAMILNDGDMTTVLLALKGSIHFVVKGLIPSQVPESSVNKSCLMTMPSLFVQEHGGKLKLQDFVVLRSASTPASTTTPWMVRLRIRKFPGNSFQIYFDEGWRAFATRNELVVGDSSIFHLEGTSEFDVYIFRRTTGSPIAISSCHALTEWSTDSEISRKNGQYHFSAGCSRHLSTERISESSVDDQCDVVAKKRKIGEESAVSTSCPLHYSSFMNFLFSGLENVQVSSSQMRHDFQNNQEPSLDHQGFKMPFTGNESAQNTGVGKVYVKKEFEPPKVSLPSFFHRLAKYNVQDSAGNASGARFDVPLSFVEKYGVQLQPPKNSRRVSISNCDLLLQHPAG